MKAAGTQAVADPVRVMLVDDHKLFSESLGSVIDQDEITVVGIASTGREAVAMAATEAPHVCLVDLELPDGSGIDVGKEILRVDPGMAVLAVTAHTDPGLVQEALAAGFRGYLLKDMALSHFVGAIRAVLGGQIVMPRRASQRVTGSRTPEDEYAALMREQFTRREKDVLVLLSRGYSSQRIARELSVTNNTVRTHIQNILTKLQAHSRLEAVALAIRYGIISSRDGKQFHP